MRVTIPHRYAENHQSRS